MAASKIEPGKPDLDSYAGFAVNRANQPREFRIRGTWYRWEPAGSAGDSVGLTQAELESADFARVAEFFSIRGRK